MSKPPKITRLLETCFDVDDLERSRKFYELFFGFPVIASGDRFCAFDVVGKSVLLLFLRNSSLAPMATAGGPIPPHGSHGPQHAAFSIEQTGTRRVASPSCRCQNRHRK